MFYPVILAGGSGERFWPLSRQKKPKQHCLALDGGDRSLLKATADRLNLASGEPDHLLIVAANDHRAQIFEQLPDLPLESLLIEPVARDTAAAILYAALTVHREEAGAVMGIFPAGHRVTDQPVFQDALRQAVSYAQTYDRRVTLSIQPTYPATGISSAVSVMRPPGRAVQFTTSAVLRKNPTPRWRRRSSTPGVTCGTAECSSGGSRLSCRPSRNSRPSFTA